jgi:hypothetical protein
MIYASELMELARKEPQKYGNKKYTVKGWAVTSDGKEVDRLTIIGLGSFVTGVFDDKWVFIRSDTQVEEIKPEPKPVSFMEAVKAAIEGKKPTIVLRGSKYTLFAEKGMYDDIGYWLKVVNEYSEKVDISTGMIDGMWTVEE